MRVDLAQVASGSRTWDVAVFGSGPAGVTVAREIAAGGKTVLLCEAGGLEYSDASQATYQGTESGIDTYGMALKATRLRYFGGTSNHWTGMCGVFQPNDFEAKRHHDLPGWPIPYDEVQSYLPAAAAVLDLPTTQFAPRTVPGTSDFRFTTVAYSAPTRFGAKFRDELFASKTIDVALDATLVDLRLGGAPREGRPQVEIAVVRDSQQRETRIRARRFVLAMGAIENARVLLNCTRDVSAGLGNESDFVGRCFMEHLNVQLGVFVAKRPEFFATKGGTLVSPSEELVRTHKVGNAVLAMHVNAEPKDYGRLAPVRRFAREMACAYEAPRDFARRFTDFACAGEGIVNTMLEQVPDRASRVSLGKEADAYGLRRSHLHWALAAADRRTARVLAMQLAGTLARLDVGRMQVSKFISDPDAEVTTWFHAHQMGTTRMSRLPKDGVVDADCRVHTVGNLYMAGASVFPTGGGINPTLTLVMLALRLGKHLRNAAS